MNALNVYLNHSIYEKKEYLKMIGFQPYYANLGFTMVVTTINTTCLLVSMTYKGVKFSIRTAKALRDVIKSDYVIEEEKVE